MVFGLPSVSDSPAKKSAEPAFRRAAAPSACASAGAVHILQAR